MSEREPSIVGTMSAKVTFSSRAKDYSIEVRAPSIDGESREELQCRLVRAAAANDALRTSRLADQAEVATLRAELEDLRAERERQEEGVLIESCDRDETTAEAAASETSAQAAVAVETARNGGGPTEEAPITNGTQPADLLEGAEVVITRGDSVENGRVEEVSTDKVSGIQGGETAETEDGGGRRTHKETLAIVRRDQSEVLLEIITHADFDPKQGHLMGDKIGSELKGKVQQRTNMSDQRWRQTWIKSLPKSGYTKLVPHDDGRRWSKGVIVDIEAVAVAIKGGKLFTDKEDELVRTHILAVSSGREGEETVARGVISLRDLRGTSGEISLDGLTEDLGGSGHAKPPLPPSPQSSSPGERLPQQEIRRLSNLMQTEVLREIITDRNFQPEGRLEGSNITGVIKKRVQTRTSMSDKQWKSTYSNVLIRGGIITLELEKDNPKRSKAMSIDLKSIAALIKDKVLFTDDEDEDLRERILALAEAEESRQRAAALREIGQDDDVAEAAADSSQGSIEVEGIQSEGEEPEPVEDDPDPAIPQDEEVQVETSPPASALEDTSAAKNNGHLPGSNHTISARVQKQLDRDRKEREEAEAARVGVQPRGLGFSERTGGGDESRLPAYSEISDEEWKRCSHEDRFMLGILSKKVTEGKFKTNKELLSAVVEAGKFGENYDLKNLPPIIKELLVDSRPPKIKFSKVGDVLKLELTTKGKEYLATQFRKVRQQLIADKRTKAKSGIKAVPEAA